MEKEIEQEAYQPIDIREIVRARNPKAAKRIPGFVFKYLSRILHLTEINEFMKQNGHLRGVEFIDQGIKLLDIKFELIGLENIPTEGKQIYVSNHPLGGLDGMLILKFIYENRQSAKSITNDFLMAVKPLRDWFVPVNKIGGQARGSIKEIENLYTSPDQVLIFPAGLCSRKIDGDIQDLEWQKHFIQKSIQHHIDVVPIFFEGRNSNFFYNLAKLRKFLNIKINFEMMYLADEMFKHRNKTFKIYFGKPIAHVTFDKSLTHKQWANHVKKIVYNLPNDLKK